MAFEKISEEELSEVGVELLDDKPALPASEVKQKFEETAKKLLAPKINALVDALQAATAAASLGAKAPDGLDGSTVQELLNALKAFADEHLSNKENPHGVKAAQTGAYTREETDQAIDDKVVAIGAGDMSRAVYDPGHRGKDACVQLYTHSKSGTVHNFAGSGMNGIAKITAAFDSGDTVQLNGVPVTATCGADPVDGDTIVNGKWVAFVADAEAGQVNFKGGGGLGITKLAQATAEPGDVVSPKTFFAGNKALKTGSIADHDSVTEALSIAAGNTASIRIPAGAYRKNASSGYPEVTLTRSQILTAYGIKVRVDISAHLGTHGSTPYANASANIYIDGTHKGGVSAESQNMNGANATNSTTVTVS